MVDPPSLDAWPKLEYDVHTARRVDLNTVTREDVKTWKPGEVVLLSGKLLTGRDAAHKRLTDMLTRGEKLPVDFKGRFITTWGRCRRCGTRLSGLRGRLLLREWTSLRGRCWRRLVCWG